MSEEFLRYWRSLWLGVFALLVLSSVYIGITSFYWSMQYAVVGVDYAFDGEQHWFLSTKTIAMHTLVLQGKYGSDNERGAEILISLVAKRSTQVLDQSFDSSIALRAIDEILSAKPELANTVGPSGVPPVFNALIYFQEDVVELFVGHGALLCQPVIINGVDYLLLEYLRDNSPNLRMLEDLENLGADTECQGQSGTL
jgi:hypothetical protein